MRAGGETSRGRPFTREALRTASVWQGGDRPRDDTGPDRPGTTGGGDPLTGLLCCLLGKGGVNDRFFERAEEWGIEPDALRECLKVACEERT